MLGCIFFVSKFEWKSNNGDPDQTPRSVASDLGLHSLAVFHKKDDMLKWVKTPMIIFFNQLLLSETMIGGEFNNASARASSLFWYQSE